jgi:hypothetical protein
MSDQNLLFRAPRASEGTYSVGPGCICSGLYPLQFQGGSLSQHDENMLYRPQLVG